MIDVENQVYTKIRDRLTTEFPSVKIAGEYVKSPPTFPFVSFMQMSNTTYSKTQSTDSLENHVLVLFEVNVYSNKVSGKKTECKSIAKVIDETMLGLGFERTMLTYVPNMNDATIYRMTGRYQGVISSQEVIYSN